MASKAKKTTAAPTPSLPPRPPIVTIMGHVDHGKTTLLDAIRSSNVATREHGGITQHIGAYQIEYQGKPITFIDTPGHAAFTKMRERGAEVTDLIILVVAADDGVKPQTVESIKHIHTAKVPLIVAINKMDAPGASPDMVKAQLTEHQIFCEGYGGQTPAVPVSALKKQGINELLEMILLVADLEGLTADPNTSVKATVIESEQHKQKGPLGTLIVQEGTLKPGDTVYEGTKAIKVRALVDEYNKPVTAATPGKPVQMIGFKVVPQVGGFITGLPAVALAEAGSAPLEATEGPKLEFILKADTAGTLEAIKNSFTGDVNLLDSGIGPITESDVLLAKAAGVFIIGFNVPVVSSAERLAEIEKVKINIYKIIYELLEYIEKKVLKLLEPTIDEEELGVAEIAAIFDMNGHTIAGCKVKSGELAKQFPLHLVRGDQTIGEVHIRSLKRGKDDLEVAKVGTECGVILRQNIDFKVGDMLKSYKKIDE